MAYIFLHHLKCSFDKCVTDLDTIRYLYCRNPGIVFSRNRKISFRDYVLAMIQMQSKSLPSEVLDYFGHTVDAPTKSAFIQQRDKFLPEGWDYLFHSFVTECRSFNTILHQGYRLLATDGSDVNISRNPEDEETFIHEGECGYNAIHVNALYDILNHTYTDFLVQGKKKLHERQALNSMIDRYDDPVPAILMADRGYESFNVFAHLIWKAMKFVIRMKDISSNGILGAYDLPDGEFDERIETTLTRRHTKETLSDPNKYTILTPVTDFDYLDTNCRYYDIMFRIVRIQVSENQFICLATNSRRRLFPSRSESLIPTAVGRRNQFQGTEIHNRSH